MRKIKYFKAKWLHGLASFIMLALMVQPFFLANRLTQPNFLILLVALICFATCLIPSKLLRIPIFSGIILLGFHHYFPIETLSFGEWMRLLFQNLMNEINNFAMTSHFVIPERVAIGFMLISTIFLAGIFIDRDKWYIPFSIIIVFLLSLEVYIHLELLLEIMIIMGVTFAFLLLKKEGKTKKSFVIHGLIVLIFSLGFATMFPTIFIGAHNEFVALTMPIRTNLNNRGFFEMLQQSNLRVNRTSGFSEDARHLGGPIFDNNRVAFTVYQEKGHYWRVETRSIYTGDGWDIDTSGNTYSISETPYTIQELYQVYPSQGVRTEAIIHLPTNTTFVPLPYGQVILSLQDDRQPFTGQLRRNQVNNRIVLTQQGRNSINEFHLSTLKPDFTTEDLRNTTLSEETVGQLIQYLQLPTTLPSRIAELSSELTTNSTTLFEKVMAIQTYLRSSGGFKYSKTDASFTPEGRDYVDYFLFDTRVGYCDNFSTAMVVMLRTLGIPSRWARGFTEGNREVLPNEAVNRYTILNSHAHSWVEVFFPGIGWIPFEPTPGYANPYRENGIEINPDSGIEAVERQETEETIEEIEENRPETEIQTEVSTNENIETTEGNRTIEGLHSIGIKAILGLFAMGIIFIFIFIYKQFYWLKFNLYLLFLAKDFEKTYRTLLKAYQKFEPRFPKEPLIEYAKRIPTSQNYFLSLTERYEESLYGDKKISLAENKELFKGATRFLYKNKKS